MSFFLLLFSHSFNRFLYIWNIKSLVVCQASFAPPFRFAASHMPGFMPLKPLSPLSLFLFMSFISLLCESTPHCDASLATPSNGEQQSFPAMAKYSHARRHPCWYREDSISTKWYRNERVVQIMQETIQKPSSLDGAQYCWSKAHSMLCLPCWVSNAWGEEVASEAGIFAPSDESWDD